MNQIDSEIAAFRENKRRAASEARQMAALQFACGIDLATALTTTGAARANVVDRLARSLRRERHKGLSRHWSYDLNRHIALKQAFDRLRSNERGGAGAAPLPDRSSS